MRYSLFILFVLATLACEKQLFKPDQASVNPQENFNHLWEACRDKYAYFDLKEIDWNAVRDSFQTAIHPNMSQDSLFNVLGAMLNTLKDDHTNLISSFKTSFFGVEYNAPDNFDFRIITDNYIGSDFVLSGAFAHNFIHNQPVGYVRLSSFGSPVTFSAINFIFNRYANAKGIVLDIRENGGGAVSNAYRLLSCFITQETLFGYSRIKNGPEINAFGTAEPIKLQPTGLYYNKPIVVLTDRGSYSASSLFALACKAFPNVTLMGDTTGGGLGLPNGEQLPNGWTYRFSITQTLDLNMRPDFEMGVPPDVTVRTNLEDRTQDAVLDSAVAFLLR